MKIIFTANIGNYDKVSPIPKKFRKGWTAIYFTDDPSTLPEGWELGNWDKNIIKDLPDVAVSRIFKIKPYLFLPEEHDLSLWIDGNRDVTGDLNTFIKGRDSGFFTMQKGNTKLSIYDAIKELGKRGDPKAPGYRTYLNMDDLQDKIKRQIEEYKRCGMKPLDGPITENSIILRKNTELNKRIGELWWEEYIRWGIWRDEPTLRFVLWKNNIDIMCESKKKICSHHRFPKPVTWFHHRKH